VFAVFTNMGIKMEHVFSKKGKETGCFLKKHNLMQSKFKLQVRVVQTAPPRVKNNCFSSFKFETQNTGKES